MKILAPGLLQQDTLVVSYENKVKKHTASRHSCNCFASELSKEEIKFDPDNPFANAMTASFVLVSPSTCSYSHQNQL